MLANYIRFKRISSDYTEDFCEAYNYLTDRKCKLDLRTAAFAHKLNGFCDPYKVDKRLSREEVDNMLDTLSSYGIVRDKRFLSKSIINLMITIWRPNTTKTMRVVAFFLNNLLLISWLPLLITGILMFVKNEYMISNNHMLIGFYFGILLGVPLHEIGHVTATLGCGGKLFEMGVMVRFFIPGAYVLSDFKCVKSKFYRVQINAAGIETNFGLVGISLILCTTCHNFGGIFLGAAISNLILALVNSTFVNGLDGAHIIGELLCGDFDFIDKAKRIVKSKRIRKRFKRKGINGRVTIAISYVITCLQIFLPILYIFNIIQVIKCFL